MLIIASGNETYVIDVLEGNIPVAVVDHIVDARHAESIVISNQADIAMMDRASIADPELPNKFLSGRNDEVRLCLSCNQGCTAAALGGFPVSCMTNPSVGYEYLNETRPAEAKKNVIVAASGLVGCETVLFLTEQHCDVTIIEMRNHVAVDEEFTRRILLMRNLKERNVKILTDAKIQEMNSEGLVVEYNGKAEEIKVESIVLAMGVKAERHLYEELKDQENVLIIGGDIPEASEIWNRFLQGFRI